MWFMTNSSVQAERDAGHDGLGRQLSVEPEDAVGGAVDEAAVSAAEEVGEVGGSQKKRQALSCGWRPGRSRL